MNKEISNWIKLNLKKIFKNDNIILKVINV